MELNFLIFPTKKVPDYNPKDFEQLLWIPKRKNPKEKIPCLYIESKIPSNKLIIFFHGNTADLSRCPKFMTPIMQAFSINVLCVEYPGYGMYPGKPCEANILEDALWIYDIVTKEMKISCENIIVLGRSIGTGPAVHLASLKKVSALILVSSYTSIKDVIRHKYGRIIEFFIQNRFENLNKIPDVECPILFIHGKKDNLIPYNASIELAKHSKVFHQISLPENMEHAKLEMETDIISNIKNFFEEIKLKYIQAEKRDEIMTNKVYIPRDFLEEPELSLKELLKQNSNNSVILRNLVLYLFLFGILLKFYKMFFTNLNAKPHL